MKIQKTSPGWEGYAKDTKWHVLDEQGNVVHYTWTKREAQEWINVAERQEEDDRRYEYSGWSSYELNVGQWS